MFPKDKNSITNIIIDPDNYLNEYSKQRITKHMKNIQKNQHFVNSKIILLIIDEYDL